MEQQVTRHLAQIPGEKMESFANTAAACCMEVGCQKRTFVQPSMRGDRVWGVQTVCSSKLYKESGLAGQPREACNLPKQRRGECSKVGKLATAQTACG